MPTFIYHLLGYGFRLITTILDESRLKKQKDDHVDLDIIKDISYSENLNKDYLLDIYQKSGEIKDERVIFFIHGGGLVYGKKEINRFACMQLARKGYKVVSISYPLAPKADVRKILDACFLALDFIVSHAREYHLDISHISLMGDSAGGLLAYHMALDNLRNSSRYQITSVGLISPMSHIKRDDNLKMVYKNAIKKKNENDEDYQFLLDSRKLFSFERKIPIIIFTSDKDFCLKDANEIKECCKKYQYEYQFYCFESKDYPLNHVFPVSYPQYKESQEVFSLVDSFFKCH